MKVSASLISQTVHREPTHSYARKLAAFVEPGQLLETTRGQWIRVLQKTSSGESLHYGVQIGVERKNLSLMHLAALEPMTPGLTKLAHFVRMATATGPIGSYVEEAITGAGLPLDPNIDWDKYLRKMYVPTLRQYTRDETLIDDAILDLIVTELYQRRILSTDSPFAHFDSEHLDTDKWSKTALPEKVTAYLKMTFKSNKEMVIRYVRRALGVGAGGVTGLGPTQSLDEPTPSDEGDNSKLKFEFGEENRDIAEFESEDEITKFLKAFKVYVSEHSAPVHAKLLNAFTDLYEQGADRAKMRSVIMNNPEFITEKGNQVNLDTYNFLLAKWSRDLRKFAEDPSSGWADTAISRALKSRGAAKEKAKKTRADEKIPQPAIASLHTADFGPEVEPVTSQTAPPPAPTNPNLQQQLNAKPVSNNLNTAQPEQNDMLMQQQQQQPQQPQQPLPPKHINPSEVPGVLVSASLENDMKVTDKESVKTASAVKFAKLVAIANQSPEEVGEALGQMRVSFLRLAKNMFNLADHCDLVAASKAAATVREKVSARNKFGAGLRQLAAEAPQEFEGAFNSFYVKLNEAVTDFEAMADNLGVTLQVPDDGQSDEFAEPTPEEGLPDPGHELDAAAPAVKPAAQPAPDPNADITA